MSTVLAVINNWPYAERVLAKARLIARATRGQMHIYCPVSSEFEELNRYFGFDNYEAVKEALLEEYRTQLEQLSDEDAQSAEVEWQSRPYRAVAEKAEQLSAEMIVMAASQHSALGDFLHKPDDWHLLRDASCPVLILSGEERAYHSVVVAVDALEETEAHASLNARILDNARLMAETLKLPLKVLSVVPDPAYIYSDFAASDSKAIVAFRSQAEKTTRERQAQILSLYGIHAQQRSVRTGRVEGVLQEALTEDGLLVIGTIANKGLKGFFLGNTAERLLRHLEGDMLVVN